MLLLSMLTCCLASLRYAQAKASFAHFMVTNSLNYTDDDWRSEISLAQTAHIQAFALNIAVGNPANDLGVAAAFRTAAGTGFQLFFSFDYAGNGPWTKQEIIDLLNQYGGSPSHFKYHGKPFVSTFEGPDQSDDWIDIKAQTGCFFVPNWSSRGAQAALELSGGVADGLFSWAAWPTGDRPLNTSVDETYLQALGSKPYMMPVSPWFFTNLPGFNKNWLWRSDDLWYDRWTQVNDLQPEFVEIISWNDYGESHYIGPLRDEAFGAFDVGKAPFNYALNLPHDGWRATLPFAIDQYRNNALKITREALQVWHRPNPSAVCADSGTTGNTASQLQTEYVPRDIVQNRVYFSAVAASEPSLSVTIGGASVGAEWTDKPDNGVGIYHGSTNEYGSLRGAVVVTAWTTSGHMTVTNGKGITADCTNGIMNWNAWVGSARGGHVPATSQPTEGTVYLRRRHIGPKRV